MSKIATIITDGNSEISGVGEVDGRAVGVAVGVGRLPTTKVALAVATC